jgi:hypothetical protein
MLTPVSRNTDASVLLEKGLVRGPLCGSKIYMSSVQGWDKTRLYGFLLNGIVVAN